MSAGADRRAPDYKKIAELFNTVCRSLPNIKNLTSGRKRRIKAVYECLNGDFEPFFKRIEDSDFLTGRKGDWSGCSFDWIFKQQNFVKILEGNYDNKAKPESSRTGYYIDYSEGASDDGIL